MIVNMGEWTAAQLEAAARNYEEHGFFLLGGLEKLVTSLFYPLLQAALGAERPKWDDVLDPAVPLPPLSREVRQRLARLTTPPSLADELLAELQPVIARLIGPLVHVSSTFHAQFKYGGAKAVDHGGYPKESDYSEVHGAYLLHQDFTGASIPTSPSAVTLWVPLNSCPDWNLRLYPGSHRRGLFCHRWIPLDDPRLGPLGKPVDVAARFGTAVVFNALLLHGTSNPGPGRRVSCDIRFFPLCGFLPSEVRSLSPSPRAALEHSLSRAAGPVLRAPLLETHAFLGEEVELESVPHRCVLNWVNYVAQVARGRADEALPHLQRFADTELGFDDETVYAAKFHGAPLYADNLRRVRERWPAGGGAGREAGAGDAPGGQNLLPVGGAQASLAERPATSDGASAIPDLSLVVPCYNEEACLGDTMTPLAEAFARAGVALQLVLVDNGSTDRTSQIIDELTARGLPVTKGVVPVNQGQGLGILTGFPLCRGRFIGYICADGQVSPEDVVTVFEAARRAPVPTLAKARRLFRPDGWLRKVTSIAYNGLMHLLFWGMPSLDVNGNPKIVPAEVLRRMELTSRDWFLEAEVMLKARYLCLNVIEINLLGKPRAGGRSRVRLATVLEFIRNIVWYRFGGPWRGWRATASVMLPVPKTAGASPA
jgi:hypothetical protein